MNVYKIKFTDADGVPGEMDVTAESASEALCYFKTTFPEGIELTELTKTNKVPELQHTGATDADNVRVYGLAQKALK